MGEEDYQCGDYQEDQQSQSEDIDVSPLLCKSHKKKIDLACAHCKAVSALLSKDHLAILLSGSDDKILFQTRLRGLVQPNMNLLQHWFCLKLQWISVKLFTQEDQCLRIITRKW